MALLLVEIQYIFQNGSKKDWNVDHLTKVPWIPWQRANQSMYLDCWLWWHNNL